MPVCSVIIPAYKCENYIEDCIHSVQNQTVRDIEIIVVNDCSPDSSRDIVLKIAESDDRIKLIDQPVNMGVAAARNTGAAAAAAPYAALLDSDDMWMPDKLERQLKLIESSNADLSYTGASCIDADGRSLERKFFVPEKVDMDVLLGGNDIVTSSVVIRRELMLKYPMVKGPFHEDYVCWMKMIGAGNRAVGINEPLTVYRFTPGSLSRNKVKSARMTWQSYKAAGVTFPRRCISFVSYALHGIRRYYS